MIILSGLETLNAYFLNQGEKKEIRVQKLIIEAKKNLQSINGKKSINEIKEITN